jgi:hypothetical protein
MAPHPERSSFRQTVEHQRLEGSCALKMHSSRILAVHANVKRPGAAAGSDVEPSVQQFRPYAAVLQAQQEVHVEMGRISRGHRRRGSCRMVDHELIVSMAAAYGGSKTIRWWGRVKVD